MKYCLQCHEPFHYGHDLCPLCWSKAAGRRDTPPQTKGWRARRLKQLKGLRAWLKGLRTRKARLRRMRDARDK